MAEQSVAKFVLPVSMTTQDQIGSLLALPSELKLIGDMPSPMSDVEQQKAIAEIPRRSADPSQNVIRRHTAGYEYVTIGYIEVGLNEIFGAGNWNSISFPGYPQTMQVSEKKITIIDRRLLIVRWANGVPQNFEGYGEGAYYLSNAAANIAASMEIAKTEAIKAAAKRIGPRFGMGLKDAIESGAVDELTGEDMAVVLQEAVGQRLMDDGTVLTAEKLDELSIMVGGMKADDLQGRALKNVVALLQTMPTMDDKMELIKEAAKRGVKADLSMSPQQLKAAVEDSKKAAFAAMPL